MATAAGAGVTAAWSTGAWTGAAAAGAGSGAGAGGAAAGCEAAGGEAAPDGSGGADAETTAWITWSRSKYTTKPEYSQREMGGVPTAATLLSGSPNLPATCAMVIPRAGAATPASRTAMPSSDATMSARQIGAKPTTPAARTALTVKAR